MAGTFRGVRAFTGGRGGLRGLAYPATWEVGENVATCYRAERVEEIPPPPAASYGGWTVYNGQITFHNGAHLQFGSPWNWYQGRGAELVEGWRHIPCSGVEPDCSCGFYAYHNRAQADQELFNPFNMHAVGVVEGYGRVVLGPLGWRAQKARIVALATPYPTTHGPTLHRYRVPVFSRMDTMLGYFPVEDLSGMVSEERGETG